MTTDCSKNKQTGAQAVNAHVGMVGDFSGAAGCFSGLVIHHVRTGENNNDSLNYLPLTSPQTHTHTHPPISNPQTHRGLRQPLWDMPTGDRVGKQQWFNTLFFRFNDVSSAIKSHAVVSRWHKHIEQKKSLASNFKVHFPSFCFWGQHWTLDFTRQQSSEGVWPYQSPVSNVAL